MQGLGLGEVKPVKAPIAHRIVQPRRRPRRVDTDVVRMSSKANSFQPQGFPGGQPTVPVS